MMTYQWKKLTPELAAVQLIAKYGLKLAFSHSGTKALRAFPSSPIQIYWQQVREILRKWPTDTA